MTIEDYMAELTAEDRLRFQKISRRLLKHTFLVRDIDEESKKDYYFAYRNRDLLEAYFELLGFELPFDTQTGVVMLKNQAAAGNSGGVQANRLALKKSESIVLCCLWLIYTERFMHADKSMSLVIDKTELDYELEKYGARDLYDKGTMTRVLQLFSHYNLLRVIGQVGEADCRIRLYPSLQFCMVDEQFEQFAQTTSERMLNTASEPEQDDISDEPEAEPV